MKTLNQKIKTGRSENLVYVDFHHGGEVHSYTTTIQELWMLRLWIRENEIMPAQMKLIAFRDLERFEADYQKYMDKISKPGTGLIYRLFVWFFGEKS